MATNGSLGRVPRHIPQTSNDLRHRLIALGVEHMIEHSSPGLADGVLDLRQGRRLCRCSRLRLRSRRLNLSNGFGRLHPPTCRHVADRQPAIPASSMTRSLMRVDNLIERLRCRGQRVQYSGGGHRARRSIRSVSRTGQRRRYWRLFDRD